MDNFQREEAFKKLPVFQKISYGLGTVGCEFVGTFTGSFLTLYYTDSAGLAAAFVGTMMLVARLFDGFSDILMGMLIEKTRTRWGKARPWLLFGAFPLALSLVLTLNIPASFTIAGKEAYAYLTYIFMAVFCYTAVNLAYHAMLPRVSLDRDDRNVTSVLRVVFSLTLTLLLNIGTPIALDALGGARTQRAWSILSLAYAALAFVCLMITFVFVKERVLLEQESDGSYAKVPIKASAKAVMTNKYFYIVLGINVITNFAVGTLGLGVYYTRDILGNESYFGLTTIFMIIPMLLAQPFIPLLIQRLSKKGVCIGAAICILLGGFIPLINPYSLPLYLLSTVLKGLGSAPITGLSPTLAADLVDYGEWKSGVHAEGFAFCATSFGSKVGTGLGAAMIGWALAFGKYDSALEQQTEITKQALINTNAGMLIVTGVILLVLFLFWDYEKLYPAIQKDMISRRG